jgi:hypothetical protein
MKKTTAIQKGKPKAKRVEAVEPTALKGWRRIAEFLGQPVSVTERWAKTGMPILHQGRSVMADPRKLNEWLGRETGEPVHVATQSSDLSAELKQGLAFVRKSGNPNKSR